MGGKGRGGKESRVRGEKGREERGKALHEGVMRGDGAYIGM